MRYLVDTNIILRLTNRDDPQYSFIARAVRILGNQGHEIILVPHVIYEFWAVATRRTNENGFGWSLEMTRSVVDHLLKDWTFLEDTPAIFAQWLELVTTYKVSGKQVHDARLAATAKAHNIEHLLTLNIEDFKRFDLKAIHPSELV
jgi:predicted nucleic acid-binding protein